MIIGSYKRISNIQKEGEIKINDLMLRLANPEINAMKKSFSYAAANIWNSQSISERKKVISSIN